MESNVNFGRLAHRGTRGKAAQYYKQISAALGSKSSLKVIRIVSAIFFILAWELIGRLGLINELFLPMPSTIFAEGIRIYQLGRFFNNILMSTLRVLVGFSLAVVVTVPLGVMFGAFPVLRAFFDPVLSIIRPLPSLSWIPLAILWLGLGEQQKYFIVFIGSFAISLQYVIEATKTSDIILIRAARNLGAGKLTIMREVILPGALPYILGGLKVVLGVSWACVISAEMIGASSGLGYLIWEGKAWNNMALVLLGMMGISLTVLFTDIVFRYIEILLLPWKRMFR